METELRGIELEEKTYLEECLELKSLIEVSERNLNDLKVQERSLEITLETSKEENYKYRQEEEKINKEQEIKEYQEDIRNYDDTLSIIRKKFYQIDKLNFSREKEIFKIKKQIAKIVKEIKRKEQEIKEIKGRLENHKKVVERYQEEVNQAVEEYNYSQLDTSLKDFLTKDINNNNNNNNNNQEDQKRIINRLLNKYPKSKLLDKPKLEVDFPETLELEILNKEIQNLRDEKKEIEIILKNVEKEHLEKVRNNNFLKARVNTIGLIALSEVDLNQTQQRQQTQRETQSENLTPDEMIQEILFQFQEKEAQPQNKDEIPIQKQDSETQLLDEIQPSGDIRLLDEIRPQEYKINDLEYIRYEIFRLSQELSEKKAILDTLEKEKPKKLLQFQMRKKKVKKYYSNK